MCCPFLRRLGQPPIRDDLVLGWSAGGREGALRCEGAGGLRAEGAGSVCPLRAARVDAERFRQGGSVGADGSPVGRKGGLRPVWGEGVGDAPFV